KLVAIFFPNVHAEFSQNLHGSGHQSFAARFLDRILSSISNNHIQSVLARGDGRSKTCRAAPSDKYVSRRHPRVLANVSRFVYPATLLQRAALAFSQLTIPDTQHKIRKQLLSQLAMYYQIDARGHV